MNNKHKIIISLPEQTLSAAKPFALQLRTHNPPLSVHPLESWAGQRRDRDT